jgi:hypothetical protein
MLVTVVAAVTYAGLLWERQSRWRSIYLDHELNSGTFFHFSGSEGPRAEEWRRYHEQMAKKYARAASYPWLPVEPDPPEPLHPTHVLDEFREDCRPATDQ